MMRGSCCAASSSTSKVRSVLPSSTNSISCGPPASSSSTLRTRRSISVKTVSSLRTGIATERRNAGVIGKQYLPHQRNLGESPRKQAALSLWPPPYDLRDCNLLRFAKRDKAPGPRPTSSLQNENVRFEQGEMIGQRGVSVRVG